MTFHVKILKQLLRIRGHQLINTKPITENQLTLCIRRMALEQKLVE